MVFLCPNAGLILWDKKIGNCKKIDRYGVCPLFNGNTANGGNKVCRMNKKRQ